MKQNKYIIWFEFPYGKTYYKDSYIDTMSIQGNLEIPEFTSDKTLARRFESKEKALVKGRFFAGKYGFGVDEV